jgi:hypothetical protein
VIRKKSAPLGCTLKNLVSRIALVLKSSLGCNFCVAKRQTLYGKTGHYTKACVENKNYNEEYLSFHHLFFTPNIHCNHYDFFSVVNQSVDDIFSQLNRYRLCYFKEDL